MQSLKVVGENNYVGMNDQFPSHLLPRGVFQLAENVVVSENRLAKRIGTMGSTTLGAFTHLGGSAFEPNGGTKRIIVLRNGSSNSQLYESTNGTSYSAIGSANLTVDLQMNFVQAANKLFGFNSVEVIDVDNSSTVTRNRSGVPKGTFGFWFHNYLFVGGVTATANRLYWSNLGDPTTFTASDYIDINANDGDMLTGLGALNDELLVFKNNSIWSITGYSGSTFSTTTIAGQNTNSRVFGFGTPSHQSIVGVGKKVLYMSFLGGTPYIRSLGQTVFGKLIDEGIVSFDIENTLNDLNKSQLSKVAGAYDGKFAYWAVPNGAATTNNLVLVYYPEMSIRGALGPIRSWVKWVGLEPQQFLVSTLAGRAKLYFTDPTVTGKVRVFDSSVYSDNGTPVVMTVNARDVMLDPQAARKCKYKYVYLKYKSGSAGTLKVNARIDQAANFALQRSISLTGSSPGLGPTGTFTLGVSVLGGADVVKQRVTLAHLTGTLFGLQFIESTANECELYDYEIFGFPKGLRDD